MLYNIHYSVVPMMGNKITALCAEDTLIMSPAKQNWAALSKAKRHLTTIHDSLVWRFKINLKETIAVVINRIG